MKTRKIGAFEFTGGVRGGEGNGRHVAGMVPRAIDCRTIGSASLTRSSKGRWPRRFLVPGGRRHRRGGGLGQHRLGMSHEVRVGRRDVGSEIGRGGRSAQRTGHHPWWRACPCWRGGLREQVQCTLALVGDESGDVDGAGDIRRIARFGDYPRRQFVKVIRGGWGNKLDHLADALLGRNFTF
jgi:hypothetical protein